MKVLTVTAGSKANPVTTNVRLNGVDEHEPLTPKLARRASRVAFGHANGATVWDNQAGVGYRLTKNAARKFSDV